MSPNDEYEYEYIDGKLYKENDLVKYIYENNVLICHLYIEQRVDYNPLRAKDIIIVSTNEGFEKTELSDGWIPNDVFSDNDDPIPTIIGNCKEADIGKLFAEYFV